MTVVRELNKQEQAVVQKYARRYEAALRQVSDIRESLDDLAAVLAPEPGEVLDVDNMRIVEDGDE